MQTKVAVIAGATGLVGEKLLSLCLQNESYAKVIILLRKPDPRFQHTKLTTMVVDWNMPLQLEGIEQGADWFCCLGTTIKKAGSQQSFYQVDHDYVIQFAQFAKQSHVKSFVCITALGSDADSKIFYNKVKGQTEKDLQNIFSALADQGVLKIVRPSLLLGNRQEFRPAEKVMTILSPVLSILLQGSMQKYRPIHAQDVALGMMQIANQHKNNQQIFESNEILKST